MSLENCERLLKHYEASAKDSNLSEQARLNAEIAAKDMKLNIENKKKVLGVKSPSKK